MDRRDRRHRNVIGTSENQELTTDLALMTLIGTKPAWGGLGWLA
jgi:hypothetical protein